MLLLIKYQTNKILISQTRLIINNRQAIKLIINNHQAIIKSLLAQLLKIKII